MPSQFAIGLKGGHEGLGGKWPVQRYEGYESKPNQSNRVCVYRRNNRVFRQCNNVACKSFYLSPLGITSATNRRLPAAGPGALSADRVTLAVNLYGMH